MPHAIAMCNLVLVLPMITAPGNLTEMLC